MLRLFSGAVIDQAMLSAASLLVGLILIRHTSDADYGHYVLAQSAILLLLSVQGAFIGGPLLVLAPQKDAEEKRNMVGALFTFQRRVSLRAALAGLALVAVLAASAAFERQSLIVWAAFVASGWLMLNREYLREVLLIYTRPQVVLGADALYVTVLIASSAMAALYASPAAPYAVLGIGLAAYCGAALLKAAVQKDPGFSTAAPKKYLAEITPLGAWATAGAAIYWTFSQGYNYLLAVQLDLSAVAAVAATRLLLMPINLLTTGVRQLLTPMAGTWYQESGMGGLLYRLLAFMLGLTALALLYCGLLWATRDWLMVAVLHKVIADRDALLLLWGAIFVVGMMRGLIMTALYVRGRFSSLTWLALWSAVVALGLATLLTPSQGPRGALIGLLAGELFSVCGVLVLVWRECRQPYSADK